MLTTLKNLRREWTPPIPHVHAAAGGIAEWLVVVVALVVLVVGIFLTGADDTLMEAIGDAWETVTAS